MIAGEAMKTALNKRGVDIERINYQENGNWLPQFHLHLYGRARSSKIQEYGWALHFPKDPSFYEKNEPFDYS
jgi:diadenosine tetraphosphate (Ap4A) HIT family hydrolase